MDYGNFDMRILDQGANKEGFKEVSEFLKTQNLKLDKNVDYTVVLENDGQVIGTGSLGKNILKCIAIDEKYRGFGISNTIASELINEEYRRGNTDLFIFTKPKNEALFKQLGFYTVEKAEKVILLENDKYGIDRYCNKLIDESLDFDFNARNYKDVSAIVMNCNPFTLGHKYLIEKASKESEIVHLFILEEDESVFSSEVRYNLVKDGICQYKNVCLHKAKDYIISNATFPTYFLKNPDEILKSSAELDANIFSKHIAKALGIKRRYVGSEPYCPVTSVYNEVLKKVLPSYEVEVREIERKSIEGDIISASKVRALLKEDKLEETKKFLPKSTYDFLNSNEGREIINKIKSF